MVKGLGAFGFGLGATKATTSKALNQSINISVGKINIGQILKYSIYLIIIFGLLVVSINFFRGFLIGIESVSCSLSNTGCDWVSGATLGLVQDSCVVCDPYAPNTVISSTFWAWEIEWVALCLLYMFLATFVGLWLYVWGKWLLDHLFNLDRYVKILDDWIYGFEWEGESERQMLTKL